MILELSGVLEVQYKEIIISSINNIIRQKCEQTLGLELEQR